MWLNWNVVKINAMLLVFDIYIDMDINKIVMLST